MRALLYARVSTADKEQDPAPQLEEMREFCRRRGWTVAGEYVDLVSSVKIRPQYNEMLKAARARRGEVILCRHFDRVGRSVPQLLGLLEEMHAKGVDIVSLNQNIDTTTPVGRLMFILIAAFAEFERSMIKERVTLGLAAARARGQKLGRPCVQADAVLMARLRARGDSIEKIGAMMRLTPSTVRRRLQTAGILHKPPKKPTRGPM